MYPAVARPHPLKTAVWAVVLVICIASAVCISQLWIFFIYPVAMLVLAVVSLTVLCLPRRSPRIIHSLERVARCYLGISILTAISSVLMFNAFPLPAPDRRQLYLVYFGSLLVSQLFWSPRLRLSPLAAFSVAMVSTMLVVKVIIGV